MSLQTKVSILAIAVIILAVVGPGVFFQGVIVLGGIALALMVQHIWYTAVVNAIIDEREGIVRPQIRSHPLED